MSEDEARTWIMERWNVSRGTWNRLERFVAILLGAMDQQNLIAQSTRDLVWARHVADSAQLLNHAESATDGLWIDLGSGAGLPGIIISILSSRPVLMVESRRKRVDFLNDVIAELMLDNAQVFAGRTEVMPARTAAVISARAYAPLDRLLGSACHLGDEKTLWILPKGRNAQNELETVRSAWQGMFHVEPSVTDPESAIVVARNVKPVKRKGQG